MNKKLSPHQVEILRLIRDEGWELGFSTGITTNTWMQKGGLSCGGRSQVVSILTLRSLERKGYIRRAKKRPKDQHWLVRYELVKGNDRGNETG